MKTTVNTSLPVGCLFDGALGYEHNAQRIINLAIQYGWSQPEPADSENENNLIFDEEEATEHLDQFAPEGYYAGWLDGDFGIWPESEDEYED